jgi:hypothetical protein
MEHGVMPSTKSFDITAHGLEKYDLSNAVFLSEEDVEKMLKPSTKERQLKTPDGKRFDFTENVLKPMFNDIFADKNDDTKLSEMGQQYWQEIQNNLDN